MKIEYSKSLNDIGVERLERLNQSTNNKYQEQIKSSKILKSAQPRVSCLLCNKKLLGSKFNHRNVQFIRCKNCDHIQTVVIPPLGHPHHNKLSTFSNIYPNLNAKEYKDRIDRIYQPKLDWIQRSLGGNLNEEDLKSKKWIELGCGAGYFLSCLAENGFKKITGYDMDSNLVKQSNTMTPEFVKTHQGDKDLHSTIANSTADIYVAFFVLEHVSEPYQFYKQLSRLPANTIFIFSVPVFGLSCLLEGAFDQLYARSLDAVVHTQVYTEKSIDYALNIANFEKISQWVFGQDAEDLSRFILDSLRKNYPDDMFDEISTELLNLQDSLQHAIDKNHLSDQRHIVAIKK